MTAIFAGMMAVAVPIAYGQTATAPLTARTTPSVVTQTAIQPGQMRASKLMGSAVYDAQDRNVGHVKDIIVDRDGKIAAVILDVGSFLGMGGKYVAISLNDLKMDRSRNDRLTLDMTKEQLQQAEAFKLDDRNTGTGTSTPPADNPPRSPR